jgi:hypothetical protein
MGRFACMRRVWVRDWEGERREAAQGTRFER